MTRMSSVAAFLLLFGTGCQSLTTFLPWSKDSEPRYSFEEVSSLESLRDRGELSLDPEIESNKSQIVQASYEEDGPRPLQSSGRVNELVTEGQTALRIGMQDPAMLNEARRIFEHALSLNVTSVEAHQGIAIAADLQKDWATAEAHYKQALNLRPGDHDLMNDLGYSYLLQGRHAEAEQYFHDVLLKNPNHRIAHVNKARLAIARNDERSARQELAIVFPAEKVDEHLARLRTDAGLPPLANGGVATRVASNSAPAPNAQLTSGSSNDLPADASVEEVLARMRLMRAEAEEKRKAQMAGSSAANPFATGGGFAGQPGRNPQPAVGNGMPVSNASANGAGFGSRPNGQADPNAWSNQQAMNGAPAYPAAASMPAASPQQNGGMPMRQPMPGQYQPPQPQPQQQGYPAGSTPNAQAGGFASPHYDVPQYGASGNQWPAAATNSAAAPANQASSLRPMQPVPGHLGSRPATPAQPSSNATTTARPGNTAPSAARPRNTDGMDQFQPGLIQQLTGGQNQNQQNGQGPRPTRPQHSTGMPASNSGFSAAPNSGFGNQNGMAPSGPQANSGNQQVPPGSNPATNMIAAGGSAGFNQTNNGAGFTRPPRILPAAEHLMRMQQPPQHPSFGESTPPSTLPNAQTAMASYPQPTGNATGAATPGQRDPGKDPMAEFESQLRQLDAQYQQAIGQ